MWQLYLAVYANVQLYILLTLHEHIHRLFVYVSIWMYCHVAAFMHIYIVSSLIVPLLEKELSKHYKISDISDKTKIRPSKVDCQIPISACMFFCHRLIIFIIHYQSLLSYYCASEEISEVLQSHISRPSSHRCL